MLSALRLILIPVTLAWLVLVGIAGATVLTVAGTIGSPSEIACACSHGPDHGTCPMHRTPAGSAQCRMRGTDDGLSVALMSMFGWVAVPPGTVADLTVVTTPRPTSHDSGLPPDHLGPPAVPPPRR